MTNQKEEKHHKRDRDPNFYTDSRISGPECNTATTGTPIPITLLFPLLLSLSPALNSTSSHPFSEGGGGGAGESDSWKGRKSIREIEVHKSG